MGTAVAGNVRSDAVFTGAVGLFMTANSACNLQANCLNTDFLRWTCGWDTSSRPPNPKPKLAALLPTTHVVLPRNEHVVEAEHGIFARPGVPLSRDRLEVSFHFNEYDYISPSNPIEGCTAFNSNVCNSYMGYLLDWVNQTDNHSPMDSATHFNGPKIEVGASSGNVWHVCLDGQAVPLSGFCTDPPEACSGKRNGWAYACQVNDKWCWAAGIQAALGNLKGQWPAQCDIVKAGLNLSTCPDEGAHSEEIVAAAIELGLSAEYHDGPPTFEDIRGWINAGMGVLAVVQWDGVSARHDIYIDGYFCNDFGEQHIRYYNIGKCSGNWPMRPHLPNNGFVRSTKFTKFESELDATWVGTYLFH